MHTCTYNIHTHPLTQILNINIHIHTHACIPPNFTCTQIPRTPIRVCTRNTYVALLLLNANRGSVVYQQTFLLRLNLASSCIHYNIVILTAQNIHKHKSNTDKKHKETGCAGHLRQWVLLAQGAF